MATRAEVAKLAGVSEATVSYVLSRKRTISEPTRQRVLAAMAHLDYRPNAMAQGLAGRRSRILALLFPSQERAISSADLEYVLAAANAAREADYHLLLWPIADRDMDEVRSLAQAGLIDGVLLMEVTLDDERVATLTEAGVAVGLIGRRREEHGDVIFADRDFVGAVTTAVEHLVGLGHRRIGFLSGSRRLRELGLGATERAEEAFVDQLRKHGLDGPVLYAPNTIEGGAEVVPQVREARLTGLVTMNVEATLGLVQSARRRAPRIPEDLSVVAIGTPDSFAAATDPALTTVAPPAEQIAATATRLLIAALDGSPVGEDEARLWAGELVERGSTARARV